MGKKLYQKEDISQEKTKFLGIPNLNVLNIDPDNETFSVIHTRYFTKYKSKCPVCGSNNTRTSKVLKRKFKDILWKSKNDFKIVDICFYQRYFRCNDCENSVFPEDINFAEKGCRYTNRLADKLADGTFRYSYKKVCDYYKVPASTASVGAIMRRTLKLRETNLSPLHSPKEIGVFEVEFYNKIYPIVLGIEKYQVYCLDILENSSEETYLSFFKQLDKNVVETVFIDPVESLYNAVNHYFFSSKIVISDECVLRYSRKSLKEIIKEDGKRCSIVRKYDKLTTFHEQLTPSEKTRIKESLKTRPRLKKAYDLYQELLLLQRGNWTYDEISNWITSLINNKDYNFPEFDVVSDMIELFETEIREYVNLSSKPTERYLSAVTGICDSIDKVPHCIYDVLRARMLFTLEQDILPTKDGDCRLGVNVDKLVANLNEISTNIREEREYGSE